MPANNSKKNRPVKLDSTARLQSLSTMQTLLIKEHEIACGYLSHLATQPDISELETHEQRQLIQVGLEKYATIAQKMLSVLEKLSDHERLLQTLTPQSTGKDGDEASLSNLQWDILVRHASQQLKNKNTASFPEKNKDISDI